MNMPAIFAKPDQPTNRTRPRGRRPVGRSCAGVHAFELICGLMILVPIVLYGLDYATVLFGGQMSASCTSAACRAAAAGPPSGFASAQNPSSNPWTRASAVLKRMANPTAVVRIKSTVIVKETVTQAPVAPYGGPFIGTCTVKTRTDVFPPFLLPFVSPHVVVYNIQTYPWTWVMPSGYALINKGVMPLAGPKLSDPIPDNAP